MRTASPPTPEVQAQHLQATAAQVWIEGGMLCLRAPGAPRALRLSETSRRIWEGFEYPETVGKVAADLAVAFAQEEDEEGIREDVQTAVGWFLERGLMARVPAPRPEESLRTRYLSLLKKSLCNVLYPEHELRISHLRKRPAPLDPIEELRFLRDIRFEKEEAYRTLLDSKQDVIYGMSAGIPVPLAHTMVGLSALKNLEWCAADLFRRGIPGAFLEAGVCQGGAAIFMRALQVTFGEGARQTWLVDSFQGLPAPREPVDLESGLDFSEASMPQIACSLEEVRDHFLRYGLLDGQVRFVPGWFEDTLPGLPVGQLALLRVDADLYSSTRDVLDHLYDRVVPGGFIIVDDYGAFSFCQRAVDEFRARRRLQAPLRQVDRTVVFWEKTDP